MPSVRDDGTTVTLDLHGATVDDAIDATFRTLYLAEERGRQQMKIIHGSSTSRGPGDRRTIKRALYDLLDNGSLGAHTTTSMRSRNTLVLALDITASSDSTRIRERDVFG